MEQGKSKIWAIALRDRIISTKTEINQTKAFAQGRMEMARESCKRLPNNEVLIQQVQYWQRIVNDCDRQLKNY